MNSGMTLIVRNVSKLVVGFIAVFGLYVALTGHISPGGGFAGGVILAAAAVLIVLAFGKDYAGKLLTEPGCHVWDAVGALAFLLIALLGYFAGDFFLNFFTKVGNPPGHDVTTLNSGGTIALSNLAIFVKVGAGLAGAFLALAAFRRHTETRETYL